MVTTASEQRSQRSSTEIGRSGAGEPAGAQALTPERFYELDGVRLLYLGRGASGLHWFREAKPVFRVRDMSEELASTLLERGQLKPCPS